MRYAGALMKSSRITQDFLTTIPLLCYSEWGRLSGQISPNCGRRRKSRVSFPASHDTLCLSNDLFPWVRFLAVCSRAVGERRSARKNGKNGRRSGIDGGKVETQAVRHSRTG